MRAVRILLAVAALAAAAWFLPASVGGTASYVVTHGISMEPGFHAGDLAVVRKAGDYHVGDVVAYHSEQMKTVVMHRVISIHGDRYSFKGDNNNFTDVDHPAAADFLGRLAVRVPQGGVWLQWLGSPLGLAVASFALLASGSGTAGLVIVRKRRNNRRKETSMSRHITRNRMSGLQSMNGLPAGLRTTGAATLVLGLLGTVLGIVAWSGPLEERATTQVKSGTRVDFSYSAEVGRSAAYDGSTASSPGPVFRKLANTVDAHFTYHGEPGSISVAAELSTPGGWRSLVPLQDPTSFTGNEYSNTVRLDLKSFDAKAQAAATITGLAASPVTITLVPQVTTASGTEFKPELKLSLTPLQLSVPGSGNALTVTDTSTVQQPALAPRTLGFNGLSISAANARVIAVALLLTALLAAVIVAILARRSAPVNEGAAIRRRYAALLVRVHPMPAPQGMPVIDVTTFPTLAKLAERYGLLILHWARSDVETFVVQDENISYRYRAGDPPAKSNASAALVPGDA